MEFVLMMAGMRKEKQVSSEISVSLENELQETQLCQLKHSAFQAYLSTFASLPMSENTIFLSYSSSRIACYSAQFGHVRETSFC